MAFHRNCPSIPAFFNKGTDVKEYAMAQDDFERPAERIRQRRDDRWNRPAMGVLAIAVLTMLGVLFLTNTSNEPERVSENAPVTTQPAPRAQPPG